MISCSDTSQTSELYDSENTNYRAKVESANFSVSVQHNVGNSSASFRSKVLELAEQYRAVVAVELLGSYAI